MGTTPEERKAANAARAAARVAERKSARAIAKAARVAERKSAQAQARGERIAQRKNDRTLQRLQGRDTAKGKTPKADLAAYGRPSHTWHVTGDGEVITGIDLLPPAGDIA